MFLVICRMGLAISLVAMEKEKVRQTLGMQWLINDRNRCAQSKCFICVGVVPRLPKPRPRLLQHPAEGRRRLHHLVQREGGEQRSEGLRDWFLKWKHSFYTLLCPCNCSSWLTSRSTWSAPSPSVNRTLKYPWTSSMERSRTASAELWEVGVSAGVHRTLSPGSKIRRLDFCNGEAKMRDLNHTQMNVLLLFLLVGGNYKGHVDVLAPTVQELAGLEREAQSSFLHLGYLKNQLFRAFWKQDAEESCTHLMILNL